MFARLLERLGLAMAGAGIPYMIIGGQAVLRHGEPRLTKDIDVTLGVDVDRLDEVVALAGSLSLELLVDPESFTRTTMVLPCADPSSGIRVDFVFSFSAYEAEAIARAEPVRMGQAEVRFTTVEDLLVQKIVAGRPRDLEDARIVAAKNPQYDRAYVDRWVHEFAAITEAPLLDRLQALGPPGPDHS